MNGKKIIIGISIVLVFFLGGLFTGFRIWGGRISDNPERIGKDITNIRELGGSLEEIVRDAGELRERIEDDKGLVNDLLSTADGIGEVHDNIDRAGGELGGIGGQLQRDGEELKRIYFEVLKRPVEDEKIP
jgi:hypothetical protein